MSEGLRAMVAAFVVTAGGMSAQSTANRPSFIEFEVASIKANPSRRCGQVDQNAEHP
jgi:hypothetical protein